jgi:DNA-binding IclR family transcriptional regulator
MEQQQNKATTRILKILAYCIECGSPFGVTELARDLGLSKNMIFRALGTLVDQGYIARDPKGRRYELNYRVLELKSKYFHEPDFCALARPYIERLHDLTGETIILSVPAQDSIIIIDGLEGNGNAIVGVRLGMIIPLHASSASRAILASKSDREIMEYVERNKPLQSFTDQTLTTLGALISEAEEIRARGYSIGRQDFHSQAFSVSFCIKDVTGIAHGAITIGGPITRVTSKQIETMMPQISVIISELQEFASLYPASSIPSSLAPTYGSHDHE